MDVVSKVTKFVQAAPILHYSRIKGEFAGAAIERVNDVELVTVELLHIGKVCFKWDVRLEDFAPSRPVADADASGLLRYPAKFLPLVPAPLGVYVPGRQYGDQHSYFGHLSHQL